MKVMPFSANKTEREFLSPFYIQMHRRSGLGAGFLLSGTMKDRAARRTFRAVLLETQSVPKGPLENGHNTDSWGLTPEILTHEG